MKSNDDTVKQSTLSEEQIKEYTRRLVLARMRILDKHGFYGIMLMHMKFSLDSKCPTAYTDGFKIAFSPKFMDELNDDEIEFVLMHEIMHVALKHCFRGRDYEQYIFNIACDIVVNSNILKSNGGDLNTITLNKYGESMHLINNQEGNLYTAEEVYELLLQTDDIKQYLEDKKKFLDELEKQLNSRDGSDEDDSDDKGEEEVDDSGDEEIDDSGDEEEDKDNDGKKKKASNKTGKSKGKKKKKNGPGGYSTDDLFGNLFDDHSKWNKSKEVDQSTIDEINKLITEAAASAKKRPNAGDVPLGIQREIDELLNPTIDWRLLLNDFVQNENIDYSFNPPDPRYVDYDFYIPDFNVKDEKIEKIFFMVDTSGSIDDKQLSIAYREIKGALEQFENLQGYLGFFDACVYEPLPFENVKELMSIKPRGGGGTNFHSIFHYIEDNMQGDYPKSVVIITDGYAPFPNEEQCLNIPVLWIINNEEMTPTYGTVARIKDAF